MRLHHAAVLSAAALVACAPPVPLEEIAPIAWESTQSVNEVLDAASSTLAAQNFAYIRRDDAQGTVVASRGQRLRELGPGVNCQLAPDVRTAWVKHSITVHAVPLRGSSRIRIESDVQIESPALRPTTPNRGCVSTGLVEERVAIALGLPVTR